MEEELMDKSLSLAMLNALGCKNISTLNQKNDGTDVWELPKYNNKGWKLKFAVYKSGYIKVITKNSSKAVTAIILNDEARYDYLVNHICEKYMKFINI